MFRCGICGVDKLACIDIATHDCAGRDNPLGTLPITVRVTRQQLDALEQLRQTGLFGATFGDTAERVLSRGLLELLGLVRVAREASSRGARSPAARRGGSTPTARTSRRSGRGRGSASSSGSSS